MMRKTKVQEPLSIVASMEILTSLSELEEELLRAKHKDVEESLYPTRWLDLSRLAENEVSIRNALSSIHHYLERLREQEAHLLEEKQTIKGIQAIDRILEEACSKIDRYTELFGQKISHLAEYQQVKSLLQEILPEEIVNASPSLEVDMTLPSKGLASLSKEELEDVRQIREDRKGEFFFLKKEGGKAFYDYESLRRLKLLYDFDRLEEHTQDQLARLHFLQAKGVQERAADIVQEMVPYLEELRRESGVLTGEGVAASLNKAIFALFCAANPRNLPSHSTLEKEVGDYFSDYVRYLRQAIESKEYIKIKDSSVPTHRKLAALIYKLCFAFFISLHARREITLFIHKLVKGERKAGESVSEELLHDDEILRKTLESWPSGPLHKTLRAFLRGEADHGWDPLSQGLIPTSLFTLGTAEKSIHVLGMPAPLHQKSLKDAKMVKEFELFLENSLRPRKEKLLFVDLQDATRIDEHARTHVLQGFAHKEKMRGVLSYMRLAKQTSFYYQVEEYAKESKADAFIKHLQEQLRSGPSCGFFFPEELGKKEIENFSKEASSFIHAVFFAKKKQLSCRERQDFIEIFYFFLLLKSICVMDPDYVAFVSKDGLDQVMSTCADLFFCVKQCLAPCKDISREDRDFLLWLLYGPVLLARERAIHHEDIVRSAHVIETFQQGLDKEQELFFEGIHKLLGPCLFRSIDIEEAG